MGLFGGTTADAPKIGSYTSKQGVVYEEVVRVKSYTTKEKFWEHIDNVWAKVREFCVEWGQEAMGLQIGDRLLYVQSSYDNHGSKTSQTDQTHRAMKLDILTGAQ